MNRSNKKRFTGKNHDVFECPEVWKIAYIYKPDSIMWICKSSTDLEGWILTVPCTEKH